MRLVHTDTGKPVEIGETVTDFRGDKATVIGMTQPRHEGSTGRIHVRAPEGYEHGYYPSVFNCEWK